MRQTRPSRRGAPPTCHPRCSDAGMDDPGRGPDRRLLLTLGAAALVSACAPASASPAHPAGPATSTPARPRRTPSAALLARCETPAPGELTGRRPLTHVACGDATGAAV